MAKKTGLGKGLGAIFGDEALKEPERSEKKADSKREPKGSINNKEEKGGTGLAVFPYHNYISGSHQPGRFCPDGAG